ncbi:hypothetical protein [Massilia sp. Root351]|uniref:hypothetical protein n=1 Tax=Massilia sp. Root351 TaxID=1736522 RepID=UPI000AA2936C|nr:hypothetical protein [Massilia sp. Root351]
MQHDEPRRPGAARPSLLSAEPQAEAARTNILGNLESGKKKPAPAAAPASGARPSGMGKGTLWGGAALAVALLGGGAAWLAAEPGSATSQALADHAPPAQPAPAPAAVAVADGAADTAAAATDGAAAPAAGASIGAPGAALAAAAATGAALAAGGTAPSAAAAPGNSADLVAALAAPSKPSSAAAIQEEKPEKQQSLREMLNAPSPAKAKSPEPRLARNDGKRAKAEKPGRNPDKAGAKTVAKTAPRSTKAAPPAKAKQAPAPDSDVALLAALVAHTQAARPSGQPETLSVKLKQCRQLSTKGAEQCRVRTCASAKDDPLCKPVVTAAVDGAFP